MSGDDGKLIASASQTVGPYFHFGPGDHPELGSLVTPGTRGERIRVQVRVLDGDAVPVSDALVEIWQADADGRYAAPTSSAPGTRAFHGFGRLPTLSDGTCVFDTIRPGRPEADQAAHINVCLFMRGLLRHLYTRLYFAGDRDLGGDCVLALVPGERRATLVAHPHPADASLWTFDIRLQGDGETVFFDL